MNKHYEFLRYNKFKPHKLEGYLCSCCSKLIAWQELRDNPKHYRQLSFKTRTGARVIYCSPACSMKHNHRFHGSGKIAQLKKLVNRYFSYLKMYGYGQS